MTIWHRRQKVILKTILNSPMKLHFLDIVIEHMRQNEKFIMKILEDSNFKNTIMEFMLDEVYEGLNNCPEVGT